MKKSVKRLFRWFIFLLILAVAGAISGYYLLYGSSLDKELSVHVGSEMSYEEVVEQIHPHLRTGLHCVAFDLYAGYLNLSERMTVGHYRFKEGESAVRIVRCLALGEQTPVNLVIRGARTLPQLAGRIAKQIDADSVAMLNALRNKELCKELGYVNDSVIAMFIPNTYEVYWNTTPEKLMQRMKREYNNFWNENRTAKLKRCGLTKYQVITLAAIVYEESKKNDEMPTIAGVYINRLHRGMKLQADPTVKYAMGDFALRRILYKHLEYESPFNTYLYEGLPPAPICIPSVAAIDAVLDYKEHDYLYFCARAELDGRHNFARTLDEHNANARKYSAALNKLKIK